MQRPAEIECTQHFKRVNWSTYLILLVRARDFYEFIVDEGEVRINYRLVESKIKHIKIFRANSKTRAKRHLTKNRQGNDCFATRYIYRRIDIVANQITVTIVLIAYSKSVFKVTKQCWLAYVCVSIMMSCWLVHGLLYRSKHCYQ